jgi:prepilin peptidase CpaA
MFLPMVALLVWAAAHDVRTRRIPNWLTLGLMGSGLAQSFSSLHTVTPGQSLCGLAAGFGLPLLLFALNALGGGDVKLLSGVGAWLGASMVFHAFLAAAVVGLIIVLVQAACHGRLRPLFRNSAVVVINLVHMQELGADHVSRTGQACRSVDRPLPYAVPILVGVCFVIWAASGMRW